MVGSVLYRLFFLVIIPQSIQYNYYLYSIYIVFSIISNLEMIWGIQEKMCRLHAIIHLLYKGLKPLWIVVSPGRGWGRVVLETVSHGHWGTTVLLSGMISIQLEKPVAFVGVQIYMQHILKILIFLQMYLFGFHLLRTISTLKIVLLFSIS